jgi:hypothetical protein
MELSEAELDNIFNLETTSRKNEFQISFYRIKLPSHLQTILK